MVTDRLIKIARSQGRLLKTGEPVKPLTSHEDPDIYIYTLLVRSSACMLCYPYKSGF